MVELAGLARLSPFVDPVAERFTEAGYRIFLVGGVVRDLALGAMSAPADDKANDIDLTTDAHPDQIKRLVSPLAEALWSQGEKFGTIGATIEGQALEITTHRAEAYDPASRKPIVTFGSDLREDLSRRDFTINAVAIELPGQALHDPFDGIADLEARALRTPLSPEVSFGDDPLRMLRAARFIARFSLTATPELFEAAANYADRLRIVSVERVAEELERLLKVEQPAAGLAFYADAGLIDYVIEPYATLPKDRRLLGLRLAGAAVSPFLRRLGLFWPLAADPGDELQRLRLSKQETLRITRILRATKRLLEADSGPADIRRFVAEATLQDLHLVNDLAALVAEHDSELPTEHAVRVETLISELSASEDLEDLASPLTAGQIMEILAIEPGPLVGRAQRFLQTCRLDQGPIAETDAKEMLLAWMDQKQRSS